jgi:hypothetical protein
VEECGALHNKNNEKSIILNPQIEQGDKQDCLIEEKIGSVALAEIHVLNGPQHAYLMFIPKFNHVCIAMITLGVITLCIICTLEIATTET